MEKDLRIGILGLGRRWQKRYEPALRRLGGDFTIRAVCDQVQERAEREAKRLGCAVATGPTQLLEREDVDAVLFLDEQWFGLWPVEQACRVGKPVLCACSLAADDAHADALHHQVRESRLPVMMEMLPRFASVTKQLRSLFETVLGPPRLLCCDVLCFGRVTAPTQKVPSLEQSPIRDMVGSGGISLLDWCGGLLGGEPLNVMARRLEGGEFSTLFLEFSDRRGVQFTHRCHGPAVAGTTPIRRRWKERAAALRRAHGATARVQILTERGSVLVEFPSTLSWTNSEVFHTDASLGKLSSTQLQLVSFREVVQERAALQPTFADAYRVLRWLRVAVRSQVEGRLLTISG
jgi:predicted dehydrogenase